MISARMQNKIAGTLSGWYSEEWGKTIKLENQFLLIKDESLIDEITFNLKQDGLNFKLNPPTSEWAGVIEFVSI